MGTRTGTYYTGTLDGTAGSLITALDAILVTGEGWTKPYTGTNGAHYQQAGGNGFQLFVNDNATGVGLGREAIVRGCESATAFGTLTDPFPLVATVADAACVWRKSATADATARNYWAVADDRFLVMAVEFATNAMDLYVFGDIEPYWSGDNYACIVSTRAAANSALAGLSTAQTYQAATANAGGVLFFARESDGLNKAETGAYRSYVASRLGNLASATQGVYPDPQNTKLSMRVLEVRGNGTQSGVVPGARVKARGVIPYVFEPFLGTTVAGMAPFDTFTDTAYDASSNFIIFCDESATVFTAVTADRYVLQTAGTWDPGF